MRWQRQEVGLHISRKTDLERLLVTESKPRIVYFYNFSVSRYVISNLKPMSSPARQLAGGVDISKFRHRADWRPADVAVLSSARPPRLLRRRLGPSSSRRRQPDVVRPDSVEGDRQLRAQSRRQRSLAAESRRQRTRPTAAGITQLPSNFSHIIIKLIYIAYSVSKKTAPLCF